MLYEKIYGMQFFLSFTNNFDSLDPQKVFSGDFTIVVSLRLFFAFLLFSVKYIHSYCRLYEACGCVTL